MTQDTEDVVILSSRCGYHFEEDCESCQSAKDSNDYRLQSLSDRIDVLTQALETIKDLTRELSTSMNAVALVEAHDEIAHVARAALHQEATAGP